MLEALTLHQSNINHTDERLTPETSAFKSLYGVVGNLPVTVVINSVGNQTFVSPTLQHSITVFIHVETNP